MSALNPKLSRTAVGQPTPVNTLANLADTNHLLQKAIQKLPTEIRSDIVLRCDELAKLQITADAMEAAFTQLLQMIVEEREPGVKLFLHITCSHENKGEQEAITNRLSRFLIQFHTNLTPHAAWMQDAESRINRIASTLLPFGGSLQVNQLKNSGCVFCIALPGK